MRVIAGTIKRKRLITPQGKEIRPTTDKIKEAIFSAIQFELEEKVFLDLFAGSGQMGIEALSRGAKSSIFVDNNRASINIIKTNINIVQFQNRSKIIFNDASSMLKNSNINFDIAFLDPPYRLGILEKILPLTIKQINYKGIIICERPIEENLPEKFETFYKTKSYRYGRIAVDIYRQAI